MPKVKLLRPQTVGLRTYEAGETVDVDRERMRLMVQAGSAEAVDERDKPVDEAVADAALSKTADGADHLFGRIEYADDPTTGKKVRHVKAVSVRTGQRVDPLDPGRSEGLQTDMPGEAEGLAKDALAKQTKDRAAAVAAAKNPAPPVPAGSVESPGQDATPPAGSKLSPSGPAAQTPAQTAAPVVAKPKP